MTELRSSNVLGRGCGRKQPLHSASVHINKLAKQCTPMGSDFYAMFSAVL
jgi:hypothetical protein